MKMTRYEFFRTTDFGHVVPEYMDVRPEGFPNGIAVTSEMFVDIFEDEAVRFEKSGKTPREYYDELMERAEKRTLMREKMHEDQRQLISKLNPKAKCFWMEKK